MARFSLPLHAVLREFIYFHSPEQFVVLSGRRNLCIVGVLMWIRAPARRLLNGGI